MPMRDMASDISGVPAILPAVYAADSTVITIDLLGYEGCTLFIYSGAGGITFSGTNKVEFVLTESDDNSTYANVASASIVGAPTVTNGIVDSFVAAKAAASIKEIGYKGSKRYLQLLADFSGTHGTGTAIAAIAVRGFPLTGPVA